VPEAISQMLAKLQPTIDAILATTKTHKWYWVGGGSAAGVALIAVILVFGGILGPSGKQICTATLSQAKDFGVISPSASLASNSAKSTGVADRRACTAQVGEETYTLLVDLKAVDREQRKCRELKQPGCVALYSVARSDGMTTYQVREIPPDETDEAIAAKEGAAKPPAINTGGGDSGDLDSETAVDNSAGMAPAQIPPQTGETSAPPQ
jgi:hypothetical protein